MAAKACFWTTAPGPGTVTERVVGTTFDVILGIKNCGGVAGTFFYKIQIDGTTKASEYNKSLAAGRLAPFISESVKQLNRDIKITFIGGHKEGGIWVEDISETAVLRPKPTVVKCTQHFKIVDESGSGIRNAKIELTNDTAKTGYSDTFGRWSSELTKNVRYSFTISAAGYVDSFGSILAGVEDIIRRVLKDESVAPPLEGTCTQTVVVRKKNTSNTYLRGVSVEARPLSGNVVRCVTGSNGKCNLNLTKNKVYDISVLPSSGYTCERTSDCEKRGVTACGAEIELFLTGEAEYPGAARWKSIDAGTWDTNNYQVAFEYEVENPDPEMLEGKCRYSYKGFARWGTKSAEGNYVSACGPRTNTISLWSVAPGSNIEILLGRYDLKDHTWLRDIDRETVTIPEKEVPVGNKITVTVGHSFDISKYNTIKCGEVVSVPLPLHIPGQPIWLPKPIGYDICKKNIPSSRVVEFTAADGLVEGHHYVFTIYPITWLDQVVNNSVFEFKGTKTWTMENVTFIHKPICALLGIPPESQECKDEVGMFLDPIYAYDTLNKIFYHRDMHGNPAEPETLDYVLLPMVVAGSLVPMPVGKGTKLLSQLSGDLAKHANTVSKKLWLKTHQKAIHQLAAVGDNVNLRAFFDNFRLGKLSTCETILKQAAEVAGRSEADRVLMRTNMGKWIKGIRTKWKSTPSLKTKIDDLEKGADGNIFDSFQKTVSTHADDAMKANQYDKAKGIWLDGIGDNVDNLIHFENNLGKTSPDFQRVHNLMRYTKDDYIKALKGEKAISPKFANRFDEGADYIIRHLGDGGEPGHYADAIMGLSSSERNAIVNALRKEGKDMAADLISSVSHLGEARKMGGVLAGAGTIGDDLGEVLKKGSETQKKAAKEIFKESVDSIPTNAADDVAGREISKGVGGKAGKRVKEQLDKASKSRFGAGWDDLRPGQKLKMKIFMVSGVLGFGSFCQFLTEESLQNIGWGMGSPIFNKQWNIAQESLDDYKAFHNTMKHQMQFCCVFNPLTCTYFWNYIVADEEKITGWQRTITAAIGGDNPFAGGTGSVLVKSYPTAAFIYVDGIYVNEQTNSDISDITAGTHVISVYMNGYVPIQRVVSIEQGKQADCDFGNLVKVLPGEESPVSPALMFSPKAGDPTPWGNTKPTEWVKPPTKCPQPSASFSVSPVVPNVNVQVDFISTSVGGDGHGITKAEWSFGDGGSGSGRIINHTYSKEGKYDVILTITNDCGETSTKLRSITVSKDLGGISFKCAHNDDYCTRGATIYYRKKGGSWVTFGKKTSSFPVIKGGLDAGVYEVKYNLLNVMECQGEVTVKAGETVDFDKQLRSRLPKTVRTTVTAIVDGDGIRTAYTDNLSEFPVPATKYKRQEIRIIGYNAPECEDYPTVCAPSGKEAGDRLKELIPIGTEIELRIYEWLPLGYNNRIIAGVFKNGKDIAKIMLSSCLVQLVASKYFTDKYPWVRWQGEDSYEAVWCNPDETNVTISTYDEYGESMNVDVILFDNDIKASAEGGVTIKNVTPGKHTIEIQDDMLKGEGSESIPSYVEPLNQSFAPCVFDINVQPGKTYRVKVRLGVTAGELVENTREITFSTSPINAMIMIDGKSHVHPGASTAKIPIKLGEYHSVAFTATDYDPLNTAILVSPDMITCLTPSVCGYKSEKPYILVAEGYVRGFLKSRVTARSFLYWVQMKGGGEGIGLDEIIDILQAYKGKKDIGFVPTLDNLIDVVRYYKLGRPS